MFLEVDWTRPWLASVAPAARAVAATGLADMRDALNACAAAADLRNAAGLPLRFAPQAELPEGTAYETYIGARGRVPTRDNLHDYFNALVWLAFPRTKRALNALQAAQIARDGVGRARGPARDVATLFDENAAILVVPDDADGAALADALRGHRWDEAFVARRHAFAPMGEGGSADRGPTDGRPADRGPTDGRPADRGPADILLFGHALMEKLVAPYKAVTAHTWILAVGADHFAADPDTRRAAVDALLAARLAAEGLARGSYTPLPVLGVPGWWPGQDAAFYADATVFRPKRIPG